jgi:hypothetical protein
VRLAISISILPGWIGLRADWRPEYCDAHLAIGVENYRLSLTPPPVRHCPDFCRRIFLDYPARSALQIHFNPHLPVGPVWQQNVLDRSLMDTAHPNFRAVGQTGGGRKLRVQPLGRREQKAPAADPENAHAEQEQRRHDKHA